MHLLNWIANLQLYFCKAIYMFEYFNAIKGVIIRFRNYKYFGHSFLKVLMRTDKIDLSILLQFLEIIRNN